MAASRKRIPIDFVNIACDWRPLGYNLYATGRQSKVSFARASGQNSAKPPVFSSTLLEQLFEVKNEDAVASCNNRQRSRVVSIIYLSRVLCLSYSCLSSCHSCRTLSYSLCLSNQTDPGDEREAFEREGYRWRDRRGRD